MSTLGRWKEYRSAPATTGSVDLDTGADSWVSRSRRSDPRRVGVLTVSAVVPTGRPVASGIGMSYRPPGGVPVPTLVPPGTWGRTGPTVVGDTRSGRNDRNDSDLLPQDPTTTTSPLCTGSSRPPWSDRETTETRFPSRLPPSPVSRSHRPYLTSVTPLQSPRRGRSRDGTHIYRSALRRLES